MSQRATRLIDDYLRRVESALGGLPGDQRREMMDDLRAHIDEALTGTPDPSEADVRNLLDRLGTPEDLARDARDRLGVPAEARVPPGGAGLLEIAAVALTVVFFPVGILLAWVSDRWRTRDKVIATVLPILGLLVLMGSLFTVRIGMTTVAGPVRSAPPVSVERRPESSARSTPVPHEPPAPAQMTQQTGGSDVLGTILGLSLAVLGLGSPLLAGIWLAVTMRRAPSPRLLAGVSA